MQPYKKLFLVFFFPLTEVCPRTLRKGYNISGNCYPQYSKQLEDKTSMYQPKWKPLPTNSSPFVFKELCPKPWRYRSSEEMKTSPLMSPRVVYGGGGYVADLGYEMETARDVCNVLSKNNWIDRRTRAAIVEFSIFNCNVNVLVVCHYFFEFLASGGVFTYVKVDILDLYPVEAGLAQLVLLFRLVFVVMVIASMVIEIVKIVRQRRSYFKKVHNWLSIVLIIVSVTAVVIHIIREQRTQNTIKQLKANFYATVSFHDPLGLLEVETIILSLVVFLATLKLLSLLRFSKQIAILLLTVKVALRHLAYFSMMFIIIFLAFGMSGMLAFGNVTESYSSILHLCVSQFEFVLGKAVPQMDMNKVNPPLAFLYSILYISFMTVIIVNLFIAILNSSSEAIKNNQESVSDKLDLADFIVGYFTHGFVNMFRRKQHQQPPLYCENITVKDDCAYVENSLDEINARISTLGDDPYTEHYLRFLNVWLRNASIKRTQKNPKMKNALRKMEMCSHNTRNDGEEKFFSLDKTFVDEEDGRSGPSEVLLSKDKALKDLLHETDLPQSFYSLQNEISIEDISLSPEATGEAITEDEQNLSATTPQVNITREKVLQMVNTIESWRDNNAFLW